MSGAALLDTHAFLWYATGDPLISNAARGAIAHAEDVYVSAASGVTRVW